MADRNLISCEDVQESMNYLNDGNIDSESLRQVQEHIRECAVCEAAWKQLQKLLIELNDVEFEPMRDEFSEDAFIQVRAYSAKQVRLSFKPLLALAASVLLVGALFVINKPTQVSQPAELVALAPAADKALHDLRIAFNSPGTMDNVGIEIILPNSVSLVGSEQRELHWQTKLFKGKNELRLPLENSLTGNDIMRDEFVLARLTHGKQVKEFRVRLVRSEAV